MREESHDSLERLTTIGPNGTINDVLLPGRTTSASLVLENGRVKATIDCDAPAKWVVLPPLADMHVHACRAFMLGHQFPKDLKDAIELARQTLGNYTEEDFFISALTLFHRGCIHGTTRFRSHAEIDSKVKFKALNGTVRAKNRLPEEVLVEIVAFATADLDPASADGIAMLRDAIAQGAEFLGATLDFYSNSRKSIDALINLAVELGVGVDVHIDEHLDAERSLTTYFVDAISSLGPVVPAALGHACALVSLTDKRRRNVIQKLREAKVTVIALPYTNLFLQDRSRRAMRRRGLTAISELADAGVALRLGSDNVRDAFFPFGDGDLLEVAFLAVIVAQLSDPAAIVPAICAGKTRIAEDEEANFVLIPGQSLTEVLSLRPQPRYVFHRGMLTSEPSFPLDL